MPNRLRSLAVKAVAAAALLAGLALPAAATEIRPGVTYAGTPSGDPARAAMENLIFDLASSWASCNADLMRNAVTEDVEFSYPTSAISGRDKMLADLEAFCKSAKDTSIYLPEDAFFIDTESGRIAAELQFRTFQRGNRQVVNDVWIAHVRDGKLSVVKEYLDGRVKDLQALGVLQLEESPKTLTPWPARTEKWAACFPLVKAAPTNTCP
ncbi:nuclear transport factor 2 family protein [Rhizobiaceae bacterium BDR2-2]|uniref:Nuclear transport factor 2 family protein n=1 Tax=Ectorhizobium quercum TaxID=2965071 RepID=A0AAE3SVJ0_9HYPH|nr:nuclear transport factor 2 family protein [Ectorhizobium quercum]MCX8998390.1 nuclear transport factor 2 family protein [Ectorhizobium quercum]